MSKPRTHGCARPGCRQLAAKAGGYCSRSCTTRVTRARQTPERRTEIARAGRHGQRQDGLERLLARVKLATEDPDRRIVLAWQLGKAADKSARYRMRQFVRWQQARAGQAA